MHVTFRWERDKALYEWTQGGEWFFRRKFLSTSCQLLPPPCSGLLLDVGLIGVARKPWSHLWVHESIPGGDKAGPAMEAQEEGGSGANRDACIWEATCYLAHNRKLLFMTMLTHRSSYFSICSTQWLSLNASYKQKENHRKECWLQCLIPSNCTTSSHTKCVPEAIKMFLSD